MNNEKRKQQIIKAVVFIGLVIVAIILWVVVSKSPAEVSPVVTVEETETNPSGEETAPNTTGVPSPTKTPVKPGAAGGIVPEPVAVASGKTYSNDRYGVSLSYPKEFIALNEEQSKDLPWRYSSIFPGTRLFTLTLPKSFQPNTNFSKAMVTVGVSMDPTGVNGCLQAENGEINRSSGTSFSRFTLSDAGAGNYYETTSYRTLKNGACLSIETIIHSTSLAAYPANSGIKEFNKSAVQQKLNQVINSVSLL